MVDHCLSAAVHLAMSVSDRVSSGKEESGTSDGKRGLSFGLAQSQCYFKVKWTALTEKAQLGEKCKRRKKTFLFSNDLSHVITVRRTKLIADVLLKKARWQKKDARGEEKEEKRGEKKCDENTVLFVNDCLRSLVYIKNWQLLLLFFFFLLGSHTASPRRLFKLFVAWF